MVMPKVVWNSEDLAVFEALFLAGEHLQEIANELRVPYDRIVTIAASMAPEKKQVRRLAITRLTRAGKRTPIFTHSARREPPAAAIADRDRRYHAPRTITAEFFGDPRLGQSALDRKQAEGRT